MDKYKNEKRQQSTDSTDANVRRQTEKTDKKGFTNRAGDLIEKVGHEVSDAGAPNLGQKIHDVGDRLERDHKNPKHPHDV